VVLVEAQRQAVALLVALVVAVRAMLQAMGLQEIHHLHLHHKEIMVVAVIVLA
jgi:hypothetical protein